MFTPAAKNNTNAKPSNSNPFKKAKGESAFIQAKLNVGKPGDKYEVEADTVADKVVSKQQGGTLGGDLAFFSPTATPTIQKQEDTEVQEKPIAQNITPTVQLAPVEEKVQKMEEENVQSKEDEEIQSKEEENVQAKEDEEVQSKEEENVQSKEDEEVQSKEEESIQSKEDEEVQSKEEENVQAKEDEEVQSKEEESVQAKEDEEVQAKLNVSTPKKTNLSSRIKRAKGKGSEMPSTLKTKMESGFGADFSGVRIHTGSDSVQMNKDLGAKAFTNKNDIFFNEGKFSPDSKEGQTLIAHELTHTIQQGASKAKAGGKEAIESSKAETPIKAGANTKSKGDVADLETGKGDVKVEGAEVKAGTQLDKVEGKQGVEGKVGGKGGKKEAAPVTTTPRNPKEDPNFKKLEGRIDNTAKAQGDHEEPEASASAAQSAAVSPANERESMAQSGQVDAMAEAEPGTFNAADFKAKLMERIAAMQLPANQDEAANFDENNNIDEVNEAAAQDVEGEKAAAAGPVAQTTEQEPNVDAVPEREVTPLPEAPVGAKPPTTNPTAAMPPKRGDAEVNKPLEDNVAEVDQQMANNKVTDEQLEKSNEPSFMKGLDAKKEAKKDAETAPAQLRKKEQGVLNNVKAGAAGKEQAGLTGMHQVRGQLLNQVAGSQTKTGANDTSERTRIATEINKIYEKSKADVEKILNDLDTDVKTAFKAGTDLAKRKFEQHVDAKMSAYKARRYSGLIGAGRWVKDKFAGMPDEVNDFFVTGRQVYIDTMDKVITKVAEYVATKLTEAKTRVTTGKQEVQEYVASLPKNLQKLGKEAAEDINDKFDELEDSVNSKQDELVDSLAEQYMEGLNAVDARIEEMKAANRGLIDAALGFINGIIETIKKLRDLIATLLAEIQNAMDVIMEDPIGFVSTLFEGVGKGIDMFMANIQKHMLGGFVTWLTGAMGPVGITIPDDLFSLKGIFSLVMQVLGLGWDFMRKKAVLLLGEPMVEAMEKGFEMFQIIREKGVSGMWEHIKEQFTDLKETIIESIKSMLITQVIEAGIKWLLSLLIPGAGFIKAIMAIKDLIVFFVESAIMLIPSLIEAIRSLASGNVAGVAKAIEKGLAMLLPLVISLFAKLIGLGGLVKKVQKIIKKVRKRIDKAVTKMIKKAKAKFKKLFKKKKGKNKEEIRTDKEKKKDLKKAIAEADKLFAKKGITAKKIKKKLPKIKKKYRLNKIELKQDKTSKKYYVEVFINPTEKSVPKVLSSKEIDELIEEHTKGDVGGGGTAIITMIERFAARPKEKDVSIVAGAKHYKELDESKVPLENALKTATPEQKTKLEKLLKERKEALDWVNGFSKEKIAHMDEPELGASLNEEELKKSLSTLPSWAAKKKSEFIKYWKKVREPIRIDKDGREMIKKVQQNANRNTTKLNKDISKLDERSDKMKRTSDSTKTGKVSKSKIRTLKDQYNRIEGDFKRLNKDYINVLGDLQGVDDGKLKDAIKGLIHKDVEFSSIKSEISDAIKILTPLQAKLNNIELNIQNVKPVVEKL
ncbi:eCIS core domain-containing protein [Pontimicrobium sp. MEBiC01747]